MIIHNALINNNYNSSLYIYYLYVNHYFCQLKQTRVNITTNNEPLTLIKYNLK